MSSDQLQTEIHPKTKPEVSERMNRSLTKQVRSENPEFFSIHMCRIILNTPWTEIDTPDIRDGTEKIEDDKSSIRIPQTDGNDSIMTDKS